MNELRLKIPELFFIYEAWLGDFKEDILRHYWKQNAYHSVMGNGSKIIPQFESIADSSEDWMFQVGSKEFFGDPTEYLSLNGDQLVKFYEECRFDNEMDFKQDLYAVLLSTNLVFGTGDGVVHNIPIVGVW